MSRGEIYFQGHSIQQVYFHRQFINFNQIRLVVKISINMRIDCLLYSNFISNEVSSSSDVLKICSLINTDIFLFKRNQNRNFHDFISIVQNIVIRKTKICFGEKMPKYEVK